MFEKIRPLNDQVFIKKIEQEEITESGLYIPDSAKSKPQTGTVVAVGPGKRTSSGILNPINVSVNDTVYFGKFSGVEVGKDYLFVREDEILGVINQ